MSEVGEVLDDEVGAGAVDSAAVEPPIVQEAPAAAPQEPPPAITQAAPQDVMTPLKAMLEERDRRQAAERRAQQAEARIAEQERKQREAAANVPHLLDDPDGFVQWQQQQLKATRQELAQSFEDRLHAQKMAQSRDMIEDQIGDDKAKELFAWIDSWGPQSPLHDQASASPHPYRFAWKKFQEEQKARRGEEVLSKLGDKSLDDLIAEAVAKDRAEREALTQPAPNESVERLPNGQFASPSTKQRHQPASLAAVNGASVARGSVEKSGYDALFRK